MAKVLFDPSNIRNVALVGHGTCGKTSLGEAMLFNTRATNRLGNTSAGTGTLDFEPEEVKRDGSIATSFAWVTHNGKKINIIDTPGDGNFIFDSLTAMRGADAVAVVISAPDLVEVQTERVFKAAGALGLPRLIVVNKMDRERANAERVLADIKETLGITPVPLQVPIGSEATFRGVISLFQKKAIMFADDGSGTSTKQDIPADLAEAVKDAITGLAEAVAETDEELLEKYFETEELSEDEIRLGISRGITNGDIIPVIFTAAASNRGADVLLDLIAWACPSPLHRKTYKALSAEGEEFDAKVDPDEPFVAQVIHSFIDSQGKLSIFRVMSGTAPDDGIVTNQTTGEPERLGTVYSLRGTQRTSVEKAVVGDILAVAKLKNTRTNDTLTVPSHNASVPRIEYPAPMMFYTIRTTAKGDEDKLKTAVDKLIEEDPTVSTAYDELSRMLVLQGMGQAHLDLAVAKLERKFKVKVATELPLIPYRETIKKRVMGIEGKHKKQSGGSGQFGVCVINVEPLPRGGGFEFVNQIVGGSIPRQYIPSVEKGVLLRMKNGTLAGYPIVDIKVTLTDGKYHPVDSKDVAYQAAGSKGIRAALAQGGIKLLEPFYSMNIAVPTDNMGDIMGDVTGRRGRVLGMDTKGKMTFIKAVCPLAEIQRYAPDLRSMSGGKGTYTMEFHGYEDVPGNLTDQIVKDSPFRKDTDDDD